MTGEAMAERVRMVLAEAGYPDAGVFLKSRPDAPSPWPAIQGGSCPPEVSYKAFTVAGVWRRGQPCYPCWLDGHTVRPGSTGARCVEGDCQNKRVPA